MGRSVYGKKEQVALILLRTIRPTLTRQQTRSIKGQILSGDIDSAIRGLRRLCPDSACTCKESGDEHEQKCSML